MAITSNLVTAPDISNWKKYGKGHWKIAPAENNHIIYSTDGGKNWYRIDYGNSPQIVYSCHLVVDSTSTGVVNKLPEHVLPRYAKINESNTKDEKPKDVVYAQFPNFYEDVL